MAEVNEQTEPNEPEPGEPTEPTEPAPDEEEEEDAENEPAEPGPEPEPETPAGMTERELEAGRVKIEKEETRHRNRIAEIMGEEALSLMPCPLCSDFVSGLIFPVQPPDDVITKVKAAIGMPDLENYQQAKHAHKCPDCEGLGVVLSGSLVQGNVAIDCNTCHASGYVVVAQGTGELVAPTPTTGNGATEPLPGVNPNDPAVESLRARGFTVIPPMQVATGA